MVVPADVISPNVSELVFPSPMGVTAERKGNSVIPSAQYRFHLPVTGESIPQQAVHRDGRHYARESQAIKWGVVSHDDGLANLSQGIFQLPRQGSHHLGRETAVV